MTDYELGKIAYEAHQRALGHSCDAAPWESQEPGFRGAWIEAALAVKEAFWGPPESAGTRTPPTASEACPCDHRFQTHEQCGCMYCDPGSL